MNLPIDEIAVVGAGPSGLMAAEILAAAGARVTLYDHMPSPGRKLLMAGRGGLNLTHSEPLEAFLPHYGAARAALEPAIRAFPPAALTAWCEGLGQPVFTGSSGRVFPTALKASPLLRAWLARLDSLGVAARMRHRWQGFHPEGGLAFAGPEGERLRLAPRATILALGGASWPRLGSDGGWTALLPPEVAVAPLRPSNMGFLVPWSPIFRDRFQGEPLKRIALAFEGETRRGEAMVTATGIEGGAIYALSSRLREAIAASGGLVVLHLDLRPDIARPVLAARLAEPRRGQSLSGFLRKQAGLPPVAIGLVQEALHRDPPGRGGARPDQDLAGLVKALPLTLAAPQPIARAISSAGGIALGELDARFMLRRLPGVFATGEMLDWEAPTGGYLLQACFSTAVAAAQGALAWLAEAPRG
jgi:uncharacterized flavoprotein (TIGR03862 family)